MKEIFLFAFSLCFTVLLNAQVSKTASITTGNLKTTLTTEELTTVTNLTLTGNIDARDFKTMRDDMPLLAELDLSGVTVVAYTGTEGTASINSIAYPANTVPDFAFVIKNTWQSKTSLTSIILPSMVTSIGSIAFYNCFNLYSVNIPSTLFYFTIWKLRHSFISYFN